MRNSYDDLLHRAPPEPEGRRRMAREDRAAQFSPYAALTGLDEVMTETGRLTDVRPELEEDERSSVNEMLMHIARALPGSVAVRITRFQEDCRKSGGKCVTESVRVRKLDPDERFLTLEDGRRVSFDDILFLEPPDPEA